MAINNIYARQMIHNHPHSVGGGELSVVVVVVGGLLAFKQAHSQAAAAMRTSGQAKCM